MDFARVLAKDRGQSTFPGGVYEEASICFPGPSGVTLSRIAIFFLSLALLAGLWSSGLGMSLASLPTRISQGYEAARLEISFHGFRFDIVETALDRSLPRSVPVRLDPTIRKEDFFRQRFAETLYPRQVRLEAPFTIAPAGVQALADLKPGATVHLEPAGPGVNEKDMPAPSVAEPHGLLSLLLACLLLSAAIGAGALVLSALKAPTLEPGACLLAGALFVAMTSSLATVAGISLPYVLSPLVGAVGLGWLARRAHWKLKRPEPEAALLLCLLTLVLTIMFFVPASQWDARSIWLFRAKQLHHHGHFSAADFTNPAYAFSHFGYPLFFPAWQAFFSSFTRDSFSERSAALGFFGLFAALAAMLWGEARIRFGRFPGSLLAGSLILGVTGLVTSGMADGLLCLLLVCGYFLLTKDGRSRIGWIALAAASLTKWEGLVFSIGVAIAVIAADWRGRPLRLKGHLLGACATLAPASLWIAWVLSKRLTSEDTSLPDGVSPREFHQRLEFILNAFYPTISQIPFLQAGAAALVLAATLKILEGAKKRAISFSAPALLVVGLVLSFVVGVFLLTPFDLEWLRRTAMHRLLLHAAAFALIAFCELSFQGSRRRP